MHNGEARRSPEVAQLPNEQVASTVAPRSQGGIGLARPSVTEWRFNSMCRRTTKGVVVRECSLARRPTGGPAGGRCDLRVGGKLVARLGRVLMRSQRQQDHAWPALIRNGQPVFVGVNRINRGG